MKLPDYNPKTVDQEQKDFNHDVSNILNFGLYQLNVAGSTPTYIGRGGQLAVSFQGNSGTLFICTSDNTTQWSDIATFAIP